MARAKWQEEPQRFQAEIFRVVREASADVVEQGVATLEEGDDAGWLFLRLKPLNPNAASLTVYPDYPTLSMGPEGHTTEMFGSEDLRLKELRQLVRAVIDGRYEWEYRQVTRRLLFLPLWTFTQLVGTFRTDTGPLVYARQGGEPRGAVDYRTYEPYRA